MTPTFTPAAELFAAWKHDLRSGKSPTRYPVADPDNPLARIEIGPGLVTLFGGAPGAGKTALTMQLVFDALRLSPTIKVLVANVEMPAGALLDRQLARLSGVALNDIRRRQVSAEHDVRVTAGLDTLAALVPRLAFLRPPYSLENVLWSADDVRADVIVLDYVQRFAPPGEHAHRKAEVDAVMESVRRVADAGVAVVVIAAVGRQRDEKGRSGYGGLNLASFRESSELEYGADDAFLVVRDDIEDPDADTLKHVKSRYGEPRDLALRFTGAAQRFDPTDDHEGKLVSAIRDMMAKVAASPEGGA
jgi:replicative DNA helicase